MHPLLYNMHVLPFMPESQGPEPPEEEEAVRQEPCLFSVGCECNGDSVRTQ